MKTGMSDDHLQDMVEHAFKSTNDLYELSMGDELKNEISKQHAVEMSMQQRQVMLQAEMCLRLGQLTDELCRQGSGGERGE